ncbi:MAG TPA: ferritin family protein [Thermoplasmata archaeon]|nr:ferritin family protein [Thermoplasmata archaeon]
MGGSAWNALKVLDDAIEMEREGKAFFEKVSGTVKHPRTRDTFSSLAKQEEKHMAVLCKELDRLKQGKDWVSLDEAKKSTVPHDRISVFQDKDFKRIKLRPDSSELEALELGMEVEKRSIDYYRRASLEASDLRAKEVFNWLVGEEAGHLTILSAEHDSRTRAGFYYGEPEFSLEVM